MSNRRTTHGSRAPVNRNLKSHFGTTSVVEAGPNTSEQLDVGNREWGTGWISGCDAACEGAMRESRRGALPGGLGRPQALGA